MKTRAFSLIELLTVVAVLTLLFVLLTPAINSIAAASGITQGGNLFFGQIELARQLAEVRNRTIEVRILKKNGDPNFTAMQLWWPTEAQPASKPVILPQGTLLNESLSPWLVGLVSGTMPIGGAWAGATYLAFKIRPSGAIERPAGTDRKNLFLTISAREEPTPSNYVTIQVNPDTSRPILYRP
jgi:uncharacterized protein (TIGR02596 family)